MDALMGSMNMFQVGGEGSCSGREEYGRGRRHMAGGG